jgi:protein-disulfide isomerase
MTPSIDSHLIEGNPSARVRVVAYEDLQCGDCARFRVMMDFGLLPAYAALAAFEHRDFPLAKHSWARQAAHAARYFAGLRPELGVQFRSHTFGVFRDLQADQLAGHVAGFAESQGQDPALAIAALTDPAIAAAVEADYRLGLARGVAKTPTVFVNETPFIEVFTLEEISAAIAQAVAVGQ